MSKADREVFDALKIRSFPTVRLYKKDGSVVEMPPVERSVDNLFLFLKF